MMAKITLGQRRSAARRRVGPVAWLLAVLLGVLALAYWLADLSEAGRQRRRWRGFKTL